MRTQPRLGVKKLPEQQPEREEDDGIVIRSPKTIRTGRQPQEKVGPPDSLNTKLQVKAQMLSDSLYERRKSLHKTMGESFASTELPPTERLQQYKDMISSKEMLIGAIAGAAIVGRDGRLRLSTKMVDAFVELSDA